MAEWILRLMWLLVPNSGWENTYEKTAQAIDQVSHEYPLYDTNDKYIRTAAELVAVTYYESRFSPIAVNEDFGGDSLGLGQINSSNLFTLGLTRDDLFNQVKNLRATVRLLAISHDTCHRWPLVYQLSEYASGRGLCTVPAALRDSKRKMELAQDLLSAYPPFWIDSNQ
jgi:Transglycosylase SLT domain